MAVTLAITDNADGTGGVATISGANPAATITVYSQTVSGELGTATWTARGSRVGNGTIALAPAPGIGYYWWRAVEDLAGVLAASNFVYQNITDGDQSLHYRCLLAVQARIQSLNLAGVAGASVVIREAPTDRGMGDGGAVAMPAILVTPVAVEQLVIATSARDDVGFPIFVGIVDISNQELAIDLATRLKWREQIIRAFSNQRLTGVAEVHQVTVEPGSILQPGAYQQNLFASALVVFCQARLTRGLT
jgi:hypothetical protein